ncbi:hypothetical protein ACNJYA_09950 [Bradyrhizobium sp. DASA03068]|uniref:hypothetical protein n=1 Tax=Bradyrhizobium sp. BLXBL-01 TaxID=3395915 RepID=UPI003F71F244
MAISDPSAASIAELEELFPCATHEVTPTTRFVNRLPGELRLRRESKNAQETTYAATRLGIEPTNNIQAPDQVLLRNKMAKSSAAILRTCRIHLAENAYELYIAQRL